MRHARLLPLGLLVVGLLTLLGAPRSRAGDEEDRPRVERGIVYEVFHGDALHGLGRHEREIYLPGRGIAFTIENGELVVFRPSPTHFALEGETMTVPLPAGKQIEVPVLHLPGTAPRRLGEIEVSKADADRLEALLETRTKLRAVAESYLRAGAVSR